MGNTIGNAPRTAHTSSVASATSASTAAPEKKKWSPTDTFTPADYKEAAKVKVGTPVKTPHKPEDFDKMSNEQLAAFTPEEVAGLGINQFIAYAKAIDKDGGPGRDSLDPALGMALARKSFVNNMMLRMLQAGK